MPENARAEAHEASNIVFVKSGLEVTTKAVIFFSREGSTLRHRMLDLGKAQSPTSRGSIVAKTKGQHSILGVGNGRNVFQEVDGASPVGCSARSQSVTTFEKT